jgi:GTP-binding protein
MKLKNAKFIKSAVKPNDFPKATSPQGALLPEIAVAGRSNVGKSSLLNHLFGTKDLVKTSSTPGKTQLINFFSVNDSLVFVDFPGYGYAKVPLEVRKRWGPMMEAYLQNREQLKLLLLLMDIRRIPNEDDLQMIDWAVYQQIPLILVVTKVDKVTASEKKCNLEKILKAFNVDNLHYVYYSVKTNTGKEQLLKKIFTYA